MYNDGAGRCGAKGAIGVTMVYIFDWRVSRRLHVTRVTAASSGTYTSTVGQRAARPCAYTGAPNNGMWNTGGEPRGPRRCPRRYHRYLRDDD